jgi:hypothetical protein
MTEIQPASRERYSIRETNRRHCPKCKASARWECAEINHQVNVFGRIEVSIGLSMEFSH